MTNTGGWLQLGAAVVVTVGSLSAAAYFAQPSFVPVPRLDMPGVIFVGVKQGSAPAPVRVDVSLDFQPSPTMTTFGMFLKGDVDAGVPAERAGELVIGFCGGMKDVQLRTTAGGRDLKLEPPLPSSDANIYAGTIASEFSLDDDCVTTVLEEGDLTGQTIGEGGIGWALGLEGETTAATEAIAGAEHRYAFPRIGTLSLPVEVMSMKGGFGIEAVAPESVASITPTDLPLEYVPTVSSPEVENLLAPAWGIRLRSFGPVDGYRLNGVDQQQSVAVQRDLFIAAALAGTTSGGLIWACGAVGPLFDNRRRKPPPKIEAPDTEKARESLVPSSAGGDGVFPSPGNRHLIAASVLFGIAGSTLGWLISKWKR
ncbi:hypothetical protein [Arthrobacter sp. D2-10]